MEQYYYNRMNKIEQAVYHALYQGFLNIDEEIQIPRLEGEALYNVFFKLRLDHPKFSGQQAISINITTILPI